LTEVGREVYERATGILAAVDDTERVAQRLTEAPAGQLRLTCGAEFGMLRVNGWLNSYLARYPQVRAEVEYTGRLVDLVHDGYDLAIRLGELQDSRLSARKLTELHYGLYASPGYLEAMGEPTHPKELGARHSLLQFTGGAHRSGWHFQRDKEDLRINAQARLKVNNSFGARDAAIQGLGIAKLPELVAARALGAGLLKKIFSDWVVPPVPVHAVFASNRYLAPKVRAFIDHVLELAPVEPPPTC
jgi:DNA-binding transcriptional LysR family regulator